MHVQYANQLSERFAATYRPFFVVVIISHLNSTQRTIELWPWPPFVAFCGEPNCPGKLFAAIVKFDFWRKLLNSAFYSGCSVAAVVSAQPSSVYLAVS